MKPENSQAPPIPEESLYSFCLLFPQPLEEAYKGYRLHRNSEPANVYKSQLGNLTDGILRPNQLGKLADGLVSGKMSNAGGTPSTGFYELEPGSRGIIFHRVKPLYEEWANYEDRVGPVLQEAMRLLIKNSLGRIPENVTLNPPKKRGPGRPPKQ